MERPDTRLFSSPFLNDFKGDEDSKCYNDGELITEHGRTEKLRKKSVSLL